MSAVGAAVCGLPARPMRAAVEGAYSPGNRGAGELPAVYPSAVGAEPVSGWTSAAAEDGGGFGGGTR